MLVLEKDDLSHQLEAAIKANKQHSNIFLSLRKAVGASEGKASLVRKNLEDEKNQKFQQLGAEHEEKIAELDSMGPKLLSIEEIVDSHANEARTHRQVVLTGLDKIITSNWGESSFQNYRWARFHSEATGRRCSCISLAKFGNRTASKRERCPSILRH